MPRLDGKVIIITGGARGQGEGECRLFVREGAKVIITDVLDAEGEALAKETGATFLHHDVSQRGDWEKAVEHALSTHGRLDGLVNNAGIYDRSPLADTSDDLWRRIIAVNQTGVFLGLQVAGPAMARSGGGSIVNISSTAGIRGGGQHFAYGASKWAVRGMTKYAAAELAKDNIRVNSVHPGPIDTPMIANLTRPEGSPMGSTTPLQRVGTPAEVAQLVLFLLSDESSYTTGAEITIDGGICAT